MTTYRWWIVGISLVVVLAVLGLGYWGFKVTGPGPSGQEQVLTEPATGAPETGPEQVLTEPQISPEGEETILVPPEVEIGLEPEVAVSLPAYDLDMAILAASTRILPIPVTLADVSIIVSLLGPGVPLTAEEEALMFPAEEVIEAVAEEVAPAFPFEEDFFFILPGAEETTVVPTEDIVPAFPLEEEFQPFEETMVAPAEEAAPAEEGLLPEEEEQVTEELEY